METTNKKRTFCLLTILTFARNTMKTTRLNKVLEINLKQKLTVKSHELT